MKIFSSLTILGTASATNSTEIANNACQDYTIISGDTCDHIAARFATDLAHVSLYDGPCPRMIYPGQVAKVCNKDQPVPPMPVPKGCTKHIVVPGDNCNVIAAEFHTDLAHVFIGNGRACPWTIYPGQVAMVCPQNTPVPPSPPTVCTGTTYRVVPGDNCNAIAARFHTDLTHLSVADHACTWMIYPGDEVCVADEVAALESQPCSDYTIVSGDTCDRIAARFTTDLAHVSLYDGPCPRMIYPGQVAKVCNKNTPLPPVPVPTNCIKHTVAPNDNCNAIAAEYHTDLAHVFIGNGRACPWTIYPGQEAIVCPKDSPVPPTPPATKCDGTVYTVDAGDNCNLIAAKMHTDLAHLTIADHACTWMIYPGEQVCVHKKQPTPPQPTPPKPTPPKPSPTGQTYCADYEKQAFQFDTPWSLCFINGATNFCSGSYTCGDIAECSPCVTGDQKRRLRGGM